MTMNNQIEFNRKDCIGCKLCYKSCFVDVIRWDATGNLPDFKYVEDCVHCNYCEIVCPKNCIQVIPDFEGEGLHQSFNRYR